MKKSYRIVREIKGQLIDPSGRSVIAFVDCAEIEPYTPEIVKPDEPVDRLST